MKVNGTPYRTIWSDPQGEVVAIIDQTRLPHEFVIAHLRSLDDAARAIRTMQVRGAPLIGATAAFGVMLGMNKDASDTGLEYACTVLAATRPTAINLHWALERMRTRLAPLPARARAAEARREAAVICEEDVATNRMLGNHGLKLVRDISEKKSGPVNLLTHCNAGWLATVDWGTALAPVFFAHDAGISVHVWVDETRPRNQGALTAWELAVQGVPHTVIVDNAGGHLMQQGKVDLVIVGTDRTTGNGDVVNKIGTYLKALAARDNKVPFYVAAPSSSIDWPADDGSQISIEKRDDAEVSEVRGRSASGSMGSVRIYPETCPVANPAFDVTPARLVTALITERGMCPASKEGLAGLFPEKA
jgi:methylthioribose-1-phosphate isomerase